MPYNYRMQAQLQIIPPTRAEVLSIAKGIESALSGITINLSGKNISKTNGDIEKTKKLLTSANVEAKSLFETMSTKAKSFAAYTAASIPILKLVDAIQEATQEAVKYEAELLKLAQVTNMSTKYIREQSSTLLNIAQTYNIAIHKVGQLVGTLAQAGLSFREAAKAAELIGQTTLLATFDDMTATTDGFIAVMNTFNLTVTQTGRVLNTMNVLSKDYAVESADLVEAVRKTGGAFSAAGGNVEELLSMMTVVRQTTRESADTIATGFRTIFARLERPKTIDYFRDLGVELETMEGKFVGPNEAIKRISEGLQKLDITIGDTKFSEVVEEIGGIRQIQKVIPLLTKYGMVQEALAKTNESSAETFRDLEKAQEGIGYKMGKLQKEFASLISTVMQSKTFGTIVDVFLGISSAILKAVDATSAFLPLLATLGAFKLGGMLSNFQKTGSFGLLKGKAERETESGKVSKTSYNLMDDESKGLSSDIDRRSRDNLFKSGSDLEKHIKGLRSELGDVGKKINKTDVLFTNGIKNSLGLSLKGLFNPGGMFKNGAMRTPTITIDKNKGGMYTADHEFGHNVDDSLGKEQYSSNEKGSFQNQLVNLVRANIKNQLAKSGAKQDTIDYRSADNQQGNAELFADFYAKSNVEVRKILASTVDLEEGMKKLADYIKANPAERLFGDAQKHIQQDKSGISEEESLNLINNAIPKKTLTQRAGDHSLDIKKIKDAKIPLIDQLNKYSEDIKGLSPTKHVRMKWDDFIKNMALIDEIRQKMKKVEEEILGLSEKERDLDKKRIYGVLKTSSVFGPTKPPSEVFGPPRPPSDDLPKAVNKTVQAFWSLYKTIGENSMQMMLWSQVIASVAKQWGVKVNQEALSQGNGNSAVLQMIGSEVKPLGEGLNALGKMVGKSSPVGQGLRSFGLGLMKMTPAITSFLSALATIQTIGSTLDAFFSQDFKGQKEGAIRLGDEVSAAALAAKQYSQEMYRSIPVIGGFMAAFGAGTWALEDNLSLTGRIAVASARLEASMINLEKEMKQLGDAESRAIKEGNVDDRRAASGAKLEALLKRDRQGAKVVDGLNEKKNFIERNNAISGMGMVPSFLKTSSYKITESDKDAAKTFVGANAESTKGRIEKMKNDQLAMDHSNTEIIRDGGNFNDIVDNMKKTLGEKVTQENIGTVNGNEKQAVKDRKAELETAKGNTEQAKILMAKRLQEGADADIEAATFALVESEEKLAAQRLDDIINLSSLIGAQRRLNKESKLSIDIINEEIAARRMNNSFSDKENVISNAGDLWKDFADKIGTGLNRIAQSSNKIGLSNVAATLKPETITRDPKLLQQHQDLLEKTGRGKELKDATAAASKIEFLKDNTNGLREFFDSKNKQAATEEADKTDDTGDSQSSLMADSLLKFMGGSNGDKKLEKAVLDFTKDVLENGTDKIEGSLDKAGLVFTDVQIEWIKRNQESAELVGKAYNDFYNAEIEHSNRKIALAKANYDQTKSYFDEVTDFYTETKTFLSKKSGRAGELESISNQAKALDAKQRNSNTGNIINRVGDLRAGIANSEGAKGAAFTAPLEEAKVYADQIRDSINYEKQRLDLMKQSAIVLRDYNQALRDAQGDLVTEFAFGTNDERANLQRTAAYTQEAVKSGNLDNIPQEVRKDVLGFLDRFANVELPQFGGKKGSDIKGEIAANEMNKTLSLGLNPSQLKDLAAKSAHDAVPIDERMAIEIDKQAKKTQELMDAEHLLRMSILTREEANVVKFAETVEGLKKVLESALNNVAPGAGQNVTMTGNQEVIVRMPDIQSVISTEVSRMAYSAVSDKFKAMSDKLIGVQSPDGIVSAFREEAVV